MTAPAPAIRSSRSSEARYAASSPSGQATTVVPRPSTVSPVSSEPSAGSDEGAGSRRCGRASPRRPARGRPPAPGRRPPRSSWPRPRARTGAPVSSANRDADSAWSLWPWVSSVLADPQPAGGDDVEHGAPGGPRRSGPGSTTTTPATPARPAPTCWCRPGSSGRGWAPARRWPARSDRRPPAQPAGHRGSSQRMTTSSPTRVGTGVTGRTVTCSATNAAAEAAAPPPPRRRPRSGAASSPGRPPGPAAGPPGRPSRRGRPRWSGRRPPGRPASARRRTGCRSGGARTRG